MVTYTVREPLPAPKSPHEALPDTIALNRIAPNDLRTMISARSLLRIALLPRPTRALPFPRSAVDLTLSRSFHASRHAGASHRRTGSRRLPENREARLPRPLHARSAAH